MRDGMHDWVIASENMARVLATKGYHYQFVFARNAVHVDRDVKQQPSHKPSSGCERLPPVATSRPADRPKQCSLQL